MWLHKKKLTSFISLLDFGDNTKKKKRKKKNSINKQKTISLEVVILDDRESELILHTTADPFQSLKTCLELISQNMRTVRCIRLWSQEIIPG